MIWANGYLYDGVSSAQQPVRFGVDAPGRLLIEHAEGVEIVGPSEKVRVDTRIANIRRTLWLADGRQIHSDDNDAIDRMFAARAGFEALVHLLESRWQIALASIATVLIAALLLFWFGVPWAADHAALMIPIEWEQQAGTQTLSALEQMGFAPSQLPEARQAELRGQFARFVQELPEHRDYRIEFRHWLGPNAFALPGGTVVFTDDIVSLFADDDEFMAVLAHEIGHLEHRHLLRTVMRGASVAVLTAVVFGDVGSASSVLVAVPTTLVYSAYSREFERDADDFAFAELKRRGKSPHAFATVMRKLETAIAGDSADDDADWSYLSSHPETQARIEAAERAAQ